MAPLKPREDALVSVVFAAIDDPEAAAPALAALAAGIAARWRYWEMLVIAPSDEAAGLDRLIEAVPNLRVLKVLPGASVYRRRAIGAAEAIGDVVALVAFEELEAIDLFALIEAARAGGCAAVAERPAGSALDPALGALGRMGGFDVVSRHMQSLAFPRAVLTRLLAHPNRELALRFMPRDEALSLARIPAAGPARRSGGKAALFRRLALIQSLLTGAAPLVLSYTAAASALAALGGVLFGLYAVVVILTFSHVEPGWFTTSMLLSLAITFLGIAFFGLAMGMIRVVENTTPHALDQVLEERSLVDLFGRLAEELNVDEDDAAPVSAPGVPAPAPETPASDTPAPEAPAPVRSAS